MTRVFRDTYKGVHIQTFAKLKSFEIKECLRVQKSAQGLTKLTINNSHAQAEIYLYGAHLTHFQPNENDPLIFDGLKSTITPPHSVHAGIPICWPWFGPHPSDDTKPQHGFARDSLWVLHQTTQLPNGETRVVMRLNADEQSHKLFAYDFTLEVTFVIGKTLTLTLTTTNTDTKTFTITQALHTYFMVDNIADISIKGVQESSFVDYTDEKKEKNESNVLKIAEEINRVYIPTQSSCYIHDQNRTIEVSKSGSNSTTIWNPWKESGIHDLPDDSYKNFVCIETTNALSDAITLDPNTSHSVSQSIRLV